MAPYLHEGRRTSITEAIQWHGGEAEEQRKMFLKLKDNKKKKLPDYVRNLHTALRLGSW